MQQFKLVLCVLVLPFTCLLNSTFAIAIDHQALAFHHAPVHYQDTDDSDYKSDYITAINYDYNWSGTDNWDNLGNGLWPATVYYSVTESCSHYFITYSFFHPRDWTDFPFDQEHENDLEGALFIVKKDNTAYGTLQGMITVFHRDFYSYKTASSTLTNGNESIDGTISFQTYNGVARAKTVQEAKGHGLKAWPYTSDFDGSSNQDGIIYYPSLTAVDYPSSGNDRFVQYRLVNVFENNGFWQQALNEASNPGYTYNTWGTFKGDKSGGCGAGWPTCSTNAANTPWGWDDHNDGGSYRGEFALDPAHLVDHYFNGLGSFSHQYSANQYLSDLQDLGFSSSNKPSGFPSQLNLNTLYGKLTQSCQ